MTKKSLKKSQTKTCTSVTGVVGNFPLMKKEEYLQCNLKVLNDLYLVETDAPAKYEGKLEIPDAYKAFYENLPETGAIVSRGNTTKYQLEIGTKVRFGKHCGQRFKHRDKHLQLIREYDILATYETIS